MVGAKDSYGVPYAVIPFKDGEVNRTPLLASSGESDPMGAVYPTVYATPVGSQTVVPNTEVEISLFLSALADTTIAVGITQLDSENTELITGFPLGEEGENIVSFSPVYNTSSGTHTFVLRIYIKSGWARLPNDVEYIDIEFQYTVEV